MKISILKSLLTITFFFLSILISCTENCNDYLPFFTINEITVVNTDYENLNQKAFEVIPNNGSVKWGHFVVRVSFINEYHSENLLPVGGKLFADCNGPGSEGSKDGIAELFLVTLSKYNDNYSANDTLNNIVSIRDTGNFQSNSNSFLPVSTYISNNNPNIIGTFFELKLDQKPNVFNGTYRFKLIYKLNNRETFEVLTDNVKFL